MRQRRYILVGTLGGVALGAASIVIAVAYAGGGHGTYAPAKILFPYTMCLAMAIAGSITPPLMALALLEFPLYGFSIGRAASRGQTKTVVYLIIILHTLTWVLCLFVKSDTF
jgi:hypothetical protein